MSDGFQYHVPPGGSLYSAAQAFVIHNPDIAKYAAFQDITDLLKAQNQDVFKEGLQAGECIDIQFDSCKSDKALAMALFDISGCTAEKHRQTNLNAHGWYEFLNDKNNWNCHTYETGIMARRLA